MALLEKVLFPRVFFPRKGSKKGVSSPKKFKGFLERFLFGVEHFFFFEKKKGSKEGAGRVDRKRISNTHNVFFTCPPMCNHHSFLWFFM